MSEEPHFDAQETDIAGPNGVRVPMRTLYYDQSSEREIHVVCSIDRMQVYIRLTPSAQFSGVTREHLLTMLYGLGVKHGVIETGVSLFASLQSGDSPLTSYFQVARGTPTRNGDDGSIEFHVQPTSGMARYDQTESGSIDFKQLNLIENCFAGQRVASILPPGIGRAGKDVFGDELPPENGKAVHVLPGEGVVVSANGREFTAEIEGRLVYEKNKLSVVSTLEISSDIDYAIGNVDFVGKVVVHGSLLDGFYIHGKRGVKISGDVGASRISSEGDVTVSGGIKGKNAAIVTCRNLTARYIDDATVEATGNVTASNEIMNSTVEALGRISVTDGAIIGGMVCGFRGVEATVLGSEMGIATKVMAGLNWAEENKKAEIRAKMAEYLDRVKSSEVLLEPLFANVDLLARLGTEHKSELSELIAELRDVRDHLEMLLAERDSIDSGDHAGMVAKINARKMAHMGVAPVFPRVEDEIKDSVKGPVSIAPDSSGKVGFSSMTDLPPLQADPADEESPEDDKAEHGQES